ncbi:MAG: hypothetical protein P8186_17260 [Anaerolineae bacterium]|jgi:hypothetical protein
MRSSDFMKAIPDATRVHLPPALRGFRWQARPWLVQIYYDQPRLHYEVWSLRHRNVLELGLHFEHRDRSVNDRLLAHFDTHAVAIKAELGEQVEVEPWDKGWAKVYQTLPLQPFEPPYLETVALRLARMIEYLQPILDMAGA